MHWLHVSVRKQYFILQHLMWTCSLSSSLRSAAAYYHAKLLSSIVILTCSPYTGGMIAAKQPIITYPTRTNQIPRHVPPPHWASHPYVLFAAAGLLPFGTIFVELYFAMTSIWQVSAIMTCCAMLLDMSCATNGGLCV